MTTPLRGARLRAQIAFEAARLIHAGEEAVTERARGKAARRLVARWVRPNELPSISEIRDRLHELSRSADGTTARERLTSMRLVAAEWLTTLAPFAPRVEGTVVTGDMPDPASVGLIVFSDDVRNVRYALLEQGHEAATGQTTRRLGGVWRKVPTLAWRHRHDLVATVLPRVELPAFAGYAATVGQAIEWADASLYAELLRGWLPGIDLGRAVAEVAGGPDRFDTYADWLAPLEQTHAPAPHTVGDYLTHSLQVFDLVRDQCEYDEELLTAALLHEVGQASDPLRAVEMTLERIAPETTDRTRWLIAHLGEANAFQAGTLGLRGRRRVESYDDFQELMILARADRTGQKRRRIVPDVEEATGFLRNLSQENG